MTGRCLRGPVDVSKSARRAALVPLAFDDVELDAHNYLGAWQALNRTATLPHCIDQLEANGSLDNLRRLVGTSDAAYRGMVFQDSDIHKTLEAVAWVLGQQEQPELRRFLDSTAALFEAAQDEDGYLNSWFQGVHPEQRWQDLRWGHEMYCAGHLVQAAVAAARVAHHDRLLHVARRFADLLVRRFGEGGIDAVCGHPEIETALVELTRLTGDDAYARLASRMIELRGRGLLGETVFGRTYFQDHLPVREAVSATGHAVRQLYLAAGVTDVYLEHGDASLLEAMERLWQDLFSTKTYVTGGHGSRHRGESIGDPYELPPDRAYTETCAAIASFHWNWRMLLSTGKSQYADEMERALYNAIAVGVAEDGRSFFYSNPLQLRRGHDGSTEDAPSGRLSWYACACCPPNLARLAASFQHYVATQNQDGVQVHLFTAGRVRANGAFGDVELEVETDYPWNGRVVIHTVAASAAWTLGLRMPAWCESATLVVDGSRREARPDQFGYVRITGPWTPRSKVTLDLAMPTRLVRAHPYVDAVRGCGALTRGPLVYCVEEGDVGESISIDDVALDPRRVPAPVSNGTSAVAPVVLEGPVQVVAAPADQSLYQPHVVNDPTAARKEVTMRAIPYFRWANRGRCAMRVWLPLVQA